MRGLAFDAGPRTGIDMKFQTLIVTVDGDARSLAKTANVQTDTLIGNQCRHVGREEFDHSGCRVICLCSDEKGAGKNRNLLLKNGTADYFILADDDMTFVEGYPGIVQRFLEETKDADVLVFNLMEKHPRRFVNTKVKRIRRHDYAKYGAARFVLKRSSIAERGISFSELFGGSVYGSGEDTIFLRDCIKKGLKVYAVPAALAEIDNESESTWFKGYNEKFFYDKGALYACLHPFGWRLFAGRFILKCANRIKGKITVFEAAESMLRGGRDYLKNRIG